MSNTGVLSAGRIYCDLNFSGIERMPELGQEVFAEELSLHAGGGAFITAAYVSALGRASALMGTLPAQPFASIIEHEAVQRGVDLQFCSLPVHTAPQLTVAMSMAGERAFLTSRQGAALPDNHGGIFQSLRNGSGIGHLHIGELSTLLEYPQLVEQAQAAGLSVSLDCAWDDACLEHSHIGELIAQVNIFLPNEMEMEQLRTNGIDERCAALTVVKQGAAGATAHVKGKRVTDAAQPLSVIDTIGAGDAFNAGFISAWLQKRNLAACLSLGNACGALAVTRRGGASDLPDLQYLMQA